MPKLQNLLSGTLVLHCFSEPVSINPGQIIPVSEDQSKNAEILRLEMKGALKILKDDAKVKAEKVSEVEKKKESVFETKAIKSEKNNDVVVVQKKVEIAKTTTKKDVSKVTPKKSSKKTNK